MLDQLLHRAPGQVDRHGEPDALAAAAGGLDLRVDADHLAGRVEERTAGVAVVDGCIGLDRSRDRRTPVPLDSERLIAETTPTDSEPASRNGLPMAATGSPTLTREELPRGTGSSFSPSADPQHGHVGEQVVADDAGRIWSPFWNRTKTWSAGFTSLRLHAVGRVGDHVGVGQDQPVVADHEAAAARLAVREHRGDRDHAVDPAAVDERGVETAGRRADVDGLGRNSRAASSAQRWSSRRTRRWMPRSRRSRSPPPRRRRSPRCGKNGSVASPQVRFARPAG